MDSVAPSDTTTIALLDVEDSTGLYRRLGQRRTTRLLRRFDEILARASEAHGGSVEPFRPGDDGRTVLFPTPSAAVRASCVLMLALRDEAWPEHGQVRVRCALHTVPDTSAMARHGIPLIKAVRLCDAATAGQIVCTSATAERLRDEEPAGVRLVELGRVVLKGFEDEGAEVVHQVVHEGLESEFPPLIGQLDVPQSNIDRPRTSFFGRESERADVVAALERSQLVTLLGPGGAGKTRLAVEVALASLPSYPDGVWILPLDVLPDDADEEQVWQLLAEALRLRGSRDRSVREAVLRTAGSSNLLIVLDNCEHVRDAAAAVASSWLAAAQGRILATSREALGVDGELQLRLPPLPIVPSSDEAGDATSYPPAVALFEARARIAWPEFSLETEGVEHVVRVCELLDGNPLAIELAAAWIRVISVEEMVARLEHESGDWLQRSLRSDESRHGSVAATIQWGYRLLDERDRALFDRLGIFAPGFTADDIMAVCAFAPISTSQLIRSIGSLERKSMLAADLGRVSPRRFRLLETLRRFSLERQRVSGMAEEMADRHLDHYVMIVTRAESELLGRAQSDWLERLDSMLPNLRAALRFARDAPRVEQGLALAGSLWRFWFMRGMVREGHRHLESILARTEGAGDSETLAKALHGAGTLAHYLGDYDNARHHLLRSLEMRRRLGDERGVSAALNNLGMIAYEEGDLRAAGELYEQSLELKQRIGDRRGTATSLTNLAKVALDRGDYELCRRLSEQCLELAERWQDRRLATVAQYDLALCSRMQGDFAASRSILQRCLSMHEASRDKQGIAQSLRLLGNLDHMEGAFPSAHHRYDACLEIERELGNSRSIGETLLYLGELAYDEGDVEQARALLEESGSLLRSVGRRVGRTYVLITLAKLAGRSGDHARARRRLEEAASLCRETGHYYTTILTLEGAACVAAREDACEDALALASASARLREEHGTPIEPTRRRELVRELAACDGMRDQARVDRARARGRSLTLRAALELAAYW